MSLFATHNATQKFSEKFPQIKFNKLGNTELLVSPAGFGSYRVHISVEEHRQALRHAILNGINLVDTSSNYADGGSEELIGSVLSELITEKSMRREEIIIVTKAGYLQGRNYEISQQLKSQGQPFPDLVEYADGLEHCIHPAFIADQLSRSLERLRLQTIDIFLLHNPEYYLLWARQNKIPKDEAVEEFYRRIEQAFIHLEIEAQNGRIQYYGISANTFPVSSEMYEFVDLCRIWNIAESISQNHKFRVIQLPFNLLENAAITTKNQPSGQSVIEFSEGKNLGVLINRPLNAFSDNKLTRLVSIITSGNIDPATLDNLFQELSVLEANFIKNILPQLYIDENAQKNLSGLFSSATYLYKNYDRLGPYWQWIENQARFLTEQLSYAVQLVNDAPDKSKEIVEWLDEYVEKFNRLLGDLTLYYGQKAASEGQSILEKITGNNPQFKKITSLQHLALHLTALTKGVSSVLVGMRRKEYVDDVLAILKTKQVEQYDTSFWINLAK